MIDSIKIKNLRSISDSGDIELKPIMILLGGNSSGKSSFLRSFPLFTQSVDKNLRGPVSWFDTSFVDYGDYKTAKNRYAPEDDGISFEYQISNIQFINKRWIYSKIEYLDMDEFKKCNVSFTLKGDNNGTYIGIILIETSNATFEMKVKSRNDNIEFLINNESIDVSETFRFNFNTGFSILPSITCTKTPNDNENFTTVIRKKIIDILKRYCDKRLQNTTKLEYILMEGSLDIDVFFKKIKSAEGIKSFQKNIRNWTKSTPEFKKIFQLYQLLKLNAIIDIVNMELATYYHNCDYIAPMRADAGRFYRMQGLQVQSVDPSGRNLIEFIDSLTFKMKYDYDSFLKDILGITIDVSSESGMKSLRIKNQSGDFSIADVGFGYSQIIPIITKLWHTAYTTVNISKNGIMRYRDSVKSIILMEQPELHLHPAMQAKVADTFIKVVNLTRESNKCSTLIIETHSQAIINRLGRRIREKNISPDDINILLFEKDNELKNTTIKQISFTENGQLKEWPYGFFDPED